MEIFRRFSSCNGTYNFLVELINGDIRRAIAVEIAADELGIVIVAGFGGVLR